VIKSHAHLLLAPTALLSQAIPAGLMYLTPQLVCGHNSTLAEDRLWLFSVTWLMLPALYGLFAGCRASYLMLTRSHPALAWTMIIAFCVPAWMQAVFYLHAALVFLAWV